MAHRPGSGPARLRIAVRGDVVELQVELGNGRPLPIEVRRAVLALANALREDMQPPADDLSATP